MEVRECLLFICICLSVVRAGNAIQCYHCHQTSKECVEGSKKNLDVIDCPENRCFVLKYETEMPGVTVQAAYRGCHNTPYLQLLQSISDPKHLTREKIFNLCNSTLCNSARETFSKLSIFIPLVLYPIYNNIV